MEMPDDNPNPDEQPPQEELRLFGGSVSIKVGLNQLRLRLLDLTGRNRLINFKHTPGKSLQFIHSSLDECAHIIRWFDVQVYRWFG